MSDTPVAEPAELPLDSPIQCKKPGPFSTPKTTLGLWDLLELMDLYPAACEFDQPSTGGLGLCKAPFKTPPYSTDEDDLFDIISPASSSTSVGWSEHDSFKHIEPDQSKDDQSLSASALMSGKIPEGSLGENANHTLRPNEFVSDAFPSQEPSISSKKRVNPGLTMDLSGLTQTLPIECPPAPQIGCVPSPASDTYSPLLVGEMSPGRPNLVSRFSDDTTVYGGSSRDSLADPSRATSPVDVQSPRIVVDPSEPPDSSSAGPSTSASNNFSPAKPIYSKGKRPPRLNLTVSSYETVGQSKPATPGTISALESLGLLTDEKLPTRSPRPYIY